MVRSTKTNKPRAPQTPKTDDAPLPPPEHEKICLAWARCDHWPLIDAVNLLLGLLPSLFWADHPPSPASRQKRDVVHQIALNCAGDSLTVINPGAAPADWRVRPREFLQWAADRLEHVPATLSNAVSAGHAASGNPEDSKRRLLPIQRHRERCKGVASLLWEMHPTYTKMEIATLPELARHGCEGTAYAPETLSDWIKTENTNRSPGRRAKHKPPLSSIPNPL